MIDRIVSAGVDVGGTFTDASVFVGSKRFAAKVPTTPSDQSVGVIAALSAALRQAGLTPADLTAFAHGTTVGTNALLEGRLARTVLCTTRGFGDVLALRRQDRADLYRLDRSHPPPLVKRDDVIEVEERCGQDGVVRDLTDSEVRRVVERLRARRPEAVAVGLLVSFAFPEHERRLSAALRAALPDIHISTSIEVLPEIREYERISTTAIDAALGPTLRGYLTALGARAASAGAPAPAIMQSSGGLIGVRDAAAHPAWTALSGPAAGVIGASALAECLGERNVLTLDMGGTSCDVAAVVGGVAGRTSATVVGGHALSLPAIDVNTISAGGGSVAWADSGGALRVGPRSAGSEPGPAAYGRGGREPTVTDANVVLRRLDGVELGAGLRLDPALATQAIRPLADALGLSIEACAEGIIAVAVQGMVDALRRVSVERGLDPRGFALVAFGGAGPLHACQIADALEICRVIVPQDAGVLAALGLVVAPSRRDAVQSVLLPIDADGDLQTALTTLRERAEIALPGAPTAVCADCRYVGQRHHLTVDWTRPDDGPSLRSAFDREHQRRFGDHDPTRPVEVVTLRVAAERGGSALELAAAHDQPEYVGPLLLALPGSSCWIAPGWRARLGAGETVTMERRHA